MRKLLLIITCWLFLLPAFAQVTFERNGVKDDPEKYYAFINAKIQVSPEQVIENGSLLIRDGKILEVVSGRKTPPGAVVVDLAGRFIYPSFIDAWSDYGMPATTEKRTGRDGGPQMESDKKGAFGWNQAVKPEVEAHQLFTADKKAAEELRKVGFGAVITHPKDGIVRGTSCAVALEDTRENLVILKDKVGAYYSFSKGSSTQDYPGSLMGAIALLRQTHFDASWYAGQKTVKEYNISLEHYNRNLGLIPFFDAGDRLSVLRAANLGRELGFSYILKAGPDVYQRIEEVKKTGASLIIPLDFPDAFDVEDPYEALNVSLADMKHWELAPAIAARLEKAGIEFALTISDLKDKTKFLPNLRKAIDHGLSEKTALAALTTIPAKLTGIQHLAGTLQPGKVANFQILSGPLFDEKTILYQNWVQGTPYDIQPWDFLDLRGNYALQVGNAFSSTLEISGKPEAPAAKIVLKDTTKLDAKFSRTKERVTLTFRTGKDSTGVRYRLSGTWAGNRITGTGQDEKGNWVSWTATRTGAVEEKEEKKDKKEKEKVLGEVVYPFMGFGYTKEKKPAQETVLFKNATVWTNESEGIRKETDVLIRGGKVVSIGKNLSAPDARVVDATGKHLTSGIIDEHSHIAISRGVNEWTQASSAEVCICDVVNSEDINIYRQLAGGVIAAQLLHGSANPIGGRSAIIKMRWGYEPEAMKVEGAAPFIKFALGENVKQANWGDRNTVRFPQSRMGVEQVYKEFFTRALEYEKQWNTYNTLSPKAKQTVEAPRKDLELQTLLEIIRGKRFISCHSYVQSEINMLMKVAEEFGFRVNTFTHILEGYKVADKMKKHGVYASTFADWWAYKYEVIDAIPYNPAILEKEGVLTAINSDDAEMGRRLNHEAAKAVMYGGVSEEEAWKMVTLNPAKMLHLDQRTGSIKPGKDADLVLWNNNPLSVYSRVEQTYVDGICFFDLQKDLAQREVVAAERARLIEKMLEAKKSGAPTQQPKKQNQRIYHCEDMEEHHHEHDHDHE